MCRGQSMGGMLGVAGSCSLVSGSGSGCWSTSSGYWYSSSLPSDRLAAGLMCRGPREASAPVSLGAPPQVGVENAWVDNLEAMFARYNRMEADNEDLL